MKKYLRIVLSLLMVIAIGVNCAGVDAKSKGYQFKYKKVSVSMNGDAKKLISKSGKPNAKKVSASCAFDGNDYVYKYSSYILYTYSKKAGGKEYVNGITFLSDKIKTKEGIKIGDSLDAVIDKYGKAEELFGIYTYVKGESKLQFEIADDVVKNIRYLAIND